MAKSILVVDDHRLFADGLRYLLQQRYHGASLHHTSNAEETLGWLQQQTTPDLILLDLKLPGINGLSLLRQFQERGVMAPVLVVSSSESLGDAREALAHGALGFISKSCRSEELLQAIERVLAGEVYLPATWQGAAGADESRRDEGNGSGLTARQLEVLHLVAQGFSNKRIADQLGLSENTVKVHLRDAFRALGVTNRTACVREAERLGLVGG